MEIVSYNVNGIRAAISKGLPEWMEKRNADVYCFQETKASRDQVDCTVFEKMGYKHYWFSAEKKGYSGVAIFTKLDPTHVEYGFGDKSYDNEGRILRCDFGDLSVASLYIPSGSSGEERQAFKMKWLDYFHQYARKLSKQKSKLLICGDYNICHKPIDIHDPVGNKNSSGFLPEEREWMSSFIESGYVDTFREFHGDPHQYSWWTFRANARANNKGWRIDYCMATQPLRNQLKDAGILPDIKHSDHCPVWVRL